MKIDLQRVEFRYKDENNADIIVIFSPAITRPAGWTGRCNNVSIYRNGDKIAGYVTRSTMSVKSSIHFLNDALKNPTIRK